MPFQRPSPQQIRDRIAAEIEGAIDGADARLRRSLEAALTRAVAISAHELHGHMQWVAAQILPDTAEDDILDRHASMWGVGRRPAHAAIGAITATGAPDTPIPAATELRRADDTRYLTDADATIGSAGTVTIAITALVAGAAGNAAAGAKLSLIAPIAGVQSQMTVVAPGLAGGADLESPTSHRRRLLDRIQSPPHGGAEADYMQWVKEVVGDTLVWVYPLHSGIGTVGICFIMPDGSVPSSADVGRVQAYIDMERPVTAEALVFAPVADLIDLAIKLTPDSTAVRMAVAAELDDFFLREAEPGGEIPLSRIAAAISSAAGEYAHVLVSPAADIASEPGHIARLGTITWVV